jgi:hypothetical protein
LLQRQKLLALKETQIACSYNSNCFALVNFLLNPFEYDQVPYKWFLVQWHAVDATFQHGWIPWSTDMVNALRVDC